MKPPTVIGDYPEINSDEMEDKESGEEEQAEDKGAAEDESRLETKITRKRGAITDLQQFRRPGGPDIPFVETVLPPPMWPPVKLDRLGMAVAGGAGFSGMLAAGKAGVNDKGVLYIADNGRDPSESDFDTKPYLQVLTQGLAPGMSTTSFAVDLNHTVSWGVWQATATTPAQLQTDVTDPAIFTAIDRPVFWGTATATPLAGINSRSGVVNYRNVIGFIGGSNSGAISDITMDLGVNFDTASVTGMAQIYTPGELWNLNLIGSIAGPVLDLNSISGDVSGNAIQGSFDGFFTGNNAQAIFSSFDLEVISNPNIHVEGLVLVDDIDVGDLRLQGVNLDRIGMYQLIDNTPGFEHYIGKAEFDVNSELYFAENGFAPDEAQFPNAPFVTVLTQVNAPSLNNFTDGVYPVSWGIWDGVSQPARLALDEFDLSLLADINRPVHWLIADATAVAAVNAKTGFMEYRNVIAFDGIGSDGNLNALYMNLGVDFDTSNVAGDMHLYTANEFWDINLTGTVSAPGLAITGVSGLLNNTLSVNGTVNTVFTGSNAQALAGMASFEVAGNPSIFLDSMFLVDDAPVGDLRLLAGELASLNRIGIAIESNSLPGIHFTAGKANSAASPIFTDNGYMPGDPLFGSAPILDVMRQGGANLSSSFNDPTYPVSWGIWDASPGVVEVQTEAYDPLAIEYFVDPVVWMTVAPTSDAVLGSRTGAAYYHSAPMTPATQGLSNVGPGIDWLNIDLEVDFDLALFKGNLWVETNAYLDDWDIGFDGYLDGPRLAVTNMNGNYTGTGPTAGVSGSLFMVLTGA